MHISNITSNSFPELGDAFFGFSFLNSFFICFSYFLLLFPVTLCLLVALKPYSKWIPIKNNTIKLFLSSSSFIYLHYLHLDWFLKAKISSVLCWKVFWKNFIKFAKQILEHSPTFLNIPGNYSNQILQINAVIIITKMSNYFIVASLTNKTLSTKAIFYIIFLQE